MKPLKQAIQTPWEWQLKKLRSRAVCSGKIQVGLWFYVCWFVASVGVSVFIGLYPLHIWVPSLGNLPSLLTPSPQAPEAPKTNVFKDKLEVQTGFSASQIGGISVGSICSSRKLPLPDVCNFFLTFQFQKHGNTCPQILAFSFENLVSGLAVYSSSDFWKGSNSVSVSHHMTNY